MPAFVWLTSIRDLQWRWRRFLIAAIAAALVLALTLVLSGIVEHLDNEVQRTVNATGADGFVVANGVPGPFTSSVPMPSSVGDQVGGVPAIFVPLTIAADPPLDAYAIGFDPGRLGTPPVRRGRAPHLRGEIAVDAKAGVGLGETISAGGRSYSVVGVTEGLTVLGERPVIYLPIDDARDAFFDGEDIATAFLFESHPRDLPDGVHAVSRSDAVADLRRPMADTVDSISLFRTLLWIVAAAIVGSVLYLSALERSRDMAVLKATGTGNRDIAGGLVLEAVVLSVGASVLAIIVAALLAPVFPTGISLPVRLLLTAPAVAVVVGILGSLAGLRRVLRIDPALAFGGP